MNLLIDTNVLIPLEPTRPEDVTGLTRVTASLARVASESGHRLFLHPAQTEDLARDRDATRRTMRAELFNKYPCLADPPPPDARLAATIGVAAPGSNDWVDDQLLAAVSHDAVDFLVTEDRRIHSKAARCGLTDRVLTVADALLTLERLADRVGPPPPAVESIKAYQLNQHDPIFDSLRDDYPNFDIWLAKCRREQRQAWAIRAPGGQLAAVALVKPEVDGSAKLPGKVLKLCTFKVSLAQSGHRYGELLLKAVMAYAEGNHYDWVYLTVFEKHQQLIELLGQFGFEDAGMVGQEIRLTKPFTWTPAERAAMSNLQFNIRFGPSAVKIQGAPVFIVPIQPVFHDLLFPEARKQMRLLGEDAPFGNSLRKAYISRSAVRDIPAGASLFFYRSQDQKRLTVLGVAEGCLRSRDAIQVARFVGNRTVYPLEAISRLCEGEVVAVLFRQARLLAPGLGLEVLKAEGVLRAAPQSIMQVRGVGVEWLTTKLDG